MATYSGSDKRLKYLFQNGGGGGSCKVISGYYHNGDFYEDQSYTQIITGSEDSLYIDLDTTTLYLFDGTDYVEVQGGGGSGGGSFACDLLFENTNLTPTSGTSNVSKNFALSQSIDNYDAVLLVAFGYVTSELNEQYESVFIPKSEYYARAIGKTGDPAIRSAYILDVSTNSARRTFTFGFADNTTLYTLSVRSESGTEPMLYKVYGLNFGGTAHTYTTTEQIVGTWIDGKPIYELTTLLPITYAPQTGGAQNAGNQVISVANVDLITDLKILPLSPSTASHIQTCRTSAFQVSVTDVHAYSDRIQLNQMTFAANLTLVGVNGVYVIVQYTKTTD